jgi:hypothetical protein
MMKTQKIVIKKPRDLLFCLPPPARPVRRKDLCFSPPALGIYSECFHCCLTRLTNHYSIVRLLLDKQIVIIVKMKKKRKEQGKGNSLGGSKR